MQVHRITPVILLLKHTYLSDEVEADASCSLLEPPLPLVSNSVSSCIRSSQQHPVCITLHKNTAFRKNFSEMSTCCSSLYLWTKSNFLWLHGLLHKIGYENIALWQLAMPFFFFFPKTPRYTGEAASTPLWALASWICLKHGYVCLADHFPSLLWIPLLFMLMAISVNCLGDKRDIRIWPHYKFRQSIICLAVTSFSLYTWTSFKLSLWLTGNSCGNRKISADCKIRPRPRQIFETFSTLSIVLQ